MRLRCGSHLLDLHAPVVMGVLNVTPDSFSDGGLDSSADAAIARGLAMVEAGAGIVDVGGESTRPGARSVTVAEELRRVLPVIEGLLAATSVPVSIDTSKPEVMRATTAAGVSIINDVNALRAPGALEAAAASDAAVCLMHMQGEPRTMQADPRYDNVVEEVGAFLDARIETCVAAGIDRDRLLIDPGIGFGKRLEHNLQLIAGLDALVRRNVPVLVGVSRKSMLGILLNRPVTERLAGGLAVAAVAVAAGAAVIRTHDVAATVDAVRVAAAIREARMSDAGEPSE
jgi:dihydropteroate synthase